MPALSSDTKVRIEATSLMTYPDVTVVCEEPQFKDKKQTTLLNPSVLIEVVSPSTARHDRVVKLRSYKLIPALKAYLIIESDEACVTCYLRSGESTWTHTEVKGLDADLPFESLGLAIPMKDLYDRVSFPEGGRSRASSDFRILHTFSLTELPG